VELGGTRGSPGGGSTAAGGMGRCTGMGSPYRQMGRSTSDGINVGSDQAQVSPANLAEQSTPDSFDMAQNTGLGVNPFQTTPKSKGSGKTGKSRHFITSPKVNRLCYMLIA
jgi:hypothetical protein